MRVCVQKEKLHHKDPKGHQELPAQSKTKKAQRGIQFSFLKPRGITLLILSASVSSFLCALCVLYGEFDFLVIGFIQPKKIGRGSTGMAGIKAISPRDGLAKPGLLAWFLCGQSDRRLCASAFCLPGFFAFPLRTSASSAPPRLRASA